MELSPSAHIDTFCRDHLPPAEQWPDLRFDLGGLSYPERLNCAEALLDAVVARFGADRPRDVDLRRPARPRQPGRPGARRGVRPGAWQPGAAARAEQPVADRLLV